MKKIISILLLSAFLIQCTTAAFAEILVELSDKTVVNVENTDTCFAKPTLEEKYSGEYSLHFKAGGGDWLEVSQNLTKSVISGGQYVITVVAKPVKGTVWFRVGWDDTGWLSSGQRDHATDLGGGWFKYVKTVTLTANQTKFLFHNDGQAEFYIDDISLVKVGDSENLMPDGGFEDVVINGGILPPEDIPDENLTLSDTTRVNSDADNCYARITDDEKYEGSYSLHLYTAGDWLEIAQNYTQALAPGRYTLTWYAKGSGRIWFYSNWGTEWAASHSVDSVVDMGDGWKKYTRALNIDGNGDTSFLFHSDGAVDQYLDGISLTDENGTNYIIDGGFEEVTVAGGGDTVDYEKYETVILTCSDFQNQNGSEAGARTVTNIIDSIESSGLDGADAFFCCGDYANTYNETEANLNALKTVVKDFVPDVSSHIYVQGNHDAEIGTQGLAESGNNDPASGEYGVFVINEDDYMWYNTDKQRIMATAENLADYLNEKLVAGFDNPIFVLSHLPLNKSYRTTIDGDAKYANYLFHVLNQAGEQGLNIIFMYGHDHSSGYDSYLGGSSVYLAKGDSINIPQGDANVFRAETLNFTYMNAGYVGYYASASGRDSTLNMAVFGIDEDTNTVDVFRFDENGLHNLKSAGILKPEEVGQYEADTKVYTSPKAINLTAVSYDKDISTLPDSDVDINIDDSMLVLSNTTKIEGVQSDSRYARVTDNDVNSGNYSLHLYSTTAGFEFGQAYTVPNLPAGEYTLSWYIKGSDGNMAFWSNWGENARNVSLTPAIQANGWKKYTAILNIDGVDDTRFLFYADTAIDCYIDDISLTDQNGVNYIIDGSFEEVTIIGNEEEENDRYKNELILSNTTVINNVSDENCYAEASDKSFQGDEGYSLHFVSSGNADFTVSQETTELCQAGSEYVLTVYAKRISGRIWFRAGWGDNAWMVAAEEGEAVGDGWLKYEKTITIDAEGATSLFFYCDQESEFYIDHISLVKVGETENLMPDGGFDEVTVIPPIIPDYEVLAPVLKKGTEVVSQISEAGEYTVSVAAKNNALEQGISVEVIVAVFNSAGEMVNLCHDKEVVAVTEPTAPDTRLSVSFSAEAGYSAEVYVLNNRQDIDLYYNPIGY